MVMIFALQSNELNRSQLFEMLHDAKTLDRLLFYSASLDELNK